MSRETRIHKFSYGDKWVCGTDREIANQLGVLIDVIRITRYDKIHKGKDSRRVKGIPLEWIQTKPAQQIIITDPMGRTNIYDYPIEAEKKTGYSYSTIWGKWRANEGMPDWKVEVKKTHF